MINFGESNLELGFIAHQADLDKLVRKIISEYQKGNTSFAATAYYNLSESDLRYVESQVEKAFN